MLDRWTRQAGEGESGGPLLGDRRRADGTLPYQGQFPNPDTGLFTCEMEAGDSLYQQCRTYMSEADLNTLASTMVFTLKVHQHQYRNTGEPYSTHCLAVAQTLADKELDVITVTGALLHDAVEDELATVEEIRRAIFPNDKVSADRVKMIVEGASKLPSERLRKEWQDEELRQRIIGLIFATPAVAIVKVADRLHNMRTLKGIASTPKRVRFCRETLEFFVPLARLVGMEEEAEDLSEMAIAGMSQKHEAIVNRINLVLDAYMGAIQPSELMEEIDRVIRPSDIDYSNLYFNRPSVNDVFQEMKMEINEPQARDVVPKFEIVLPQKEDPLLNKWTKDAVSIYRSFVSSADYDIAEEVNFTAFFKEINSGQVDKLTFRVQRKKDGRLFDIEVYSDQVYLWKEVPLTDLYYHRHFAIEERGREAFFSDDPVAQKHATAFQKLRRLTNLYTLHRRAGADFNSWQMVKLFEIGTPKGFVRVIGIDDQGTEESWIIREGSTVMDYAWEITPSWWSTTQKVFVNGKSVPFDYQLQPRDKIHIVFDSRYKQHWDPSLIHCFRVNRQGAKAVRRHLNEMLSDPATKEQTRSRILAVGKQIIEGEPGLKGQSLMVGLRSAMSLIRDRYHKIKTEEDFYLKVGLGEVEPAVISLVAEKVGEVNAQVGRINVYFATNQVGQTRAILEIISSELGINFVGMQVTSYGIEAPTVVTVYLHPDDKPQKEKIINRISDDPQILKLGLQPEMIFYQDQLDI